MEKTRIGLLISEMNRGGAERVASILTKILCEDFQVYLIVFEKGKMAYSVSAEVLDMNIPAKRGVLNKGILFIRRCRKLIKLTKKYKIDIILSFLDSPNMVNAFSGRRGIRKFVSIRSYQYMDNKTLHSNANIVDRIYRIFEKTMISRVERVIVVSEMLRMTMMGLYPHMQDKIVTVYNPYDTDLITKLGVEELPEWNAIIEPGDFVFVTLGRLDQPKGLWHLLKIFFYVSKVVPRAKLLLIGDGILKNKILETIELYKMTQQVLLVGDQDNPFKYIKKSNMYLLTSVREGFPNALIEAMACGIPAICNDCLSGPREILYEKVNYGHQVDNIEYADYGILTPRLSVNEDWECLELELEEKTFLEAIITLVNDKNKYDMYCQLAKKRAQDFSYDACYEVYKKIILKPI